MTLPPRRPTSSDERNAPLTDAVVSSASDPAAPTAARGEALLARGLRPRAHAHPHAHPHAHEADADHHDASPPLGGGGLTRRGFLVATGFGFAGAVTGCGRPPESHLAAPAAGSEDVVPGRATWYASTCGGCAAGCGIVVRCRDGRPG